MSGTRSSSPKDPRPNLSPSSRSTSTKSSKKPSYKSESNQVRYTGDWSADSKLSAINSGYWEDPFFRFFNTTEPSKIRRTSLICRGYYVRFRVCDYFLRKVIRAINKPVQVVSLGCGMDTTFFRLLPELENSILRFYELDFKSVITTKKSIILHNDILRVMAAHKLKLLHCDLRQVASLEAALKCSDFDFNKPTLFYSECVVNYLRPNENLQILEWITENVPNSAWLAYEQCNANDSFGQIMVSHFLRNGCPLLSLLSAQSLEDQLTQLKKANFSKCKVINAWDAFLKIGSKHPPYFPSVVHKVEQQFDEYEQLTATCLHYSIRFGMKGSLLLSKQIELLFSKFINNAALQDALIHCSVEQISQSETLKLKILPSSCLPKLTAHRSVVMKNGTILTFGGSGENSMRMKHLITSKLEKKQLLSAESLGTITEIEDDDSFFEASGLYVNTRIVAENANLYERLHCSAVYVPSSVKDGESGDSVLIFGGRRSPMKPCVNDLIELNLENPSVTGEIGTVILSSMYGKSPPPRWRHGMTLCRKDGSSHILLFGGKTTETILGDCWWYSVEDFSWTERVVGSLTSSQHSEPSPRHSHIMLSDVDGNEVYLVGGMSENDSSLCEDAFWIYDVSKDSWLLIEEWSPLVRRIGHAAVKHHNFIIIVGGYGPNSTYALDFFAAVIDLDSYSVKIFNQSQPRDELFLPFGFTACVVHEPEEDTHKLIVFGGGGNCFSFGTHYNQIAYSITLNLLLRN